MPKVNWKGRDVDGTEVRSKTVREDWNEYDLEDGSNIRMKTFVTDIIRLEGEYDSDKNPVYVVKSGSILVAKSPENLRKKD